MKDSKTLLQNSKLPLYKLTKLPTKSLSANKTSRNIGSARIWAKVAEELAQQAGHVVESSFVLVLVNSNNVLGH